MAERSRTGLYGSLSREALGVEDPARSLMTASKETIDNDRERLDAVLTVPAAGRYGLRTGSTRGHEPVDEHGMAADTNLMRR